MLTVYSKNGCSSCDQAKALLEKVGMDFVVKNCDEDFEAFDFIVSEGHRTFPQIYESGNLFVQGGYKGLYALFVDGILTGGMQYNK
jgi:glutaredoxin